MFFFPGMQTWSHSRNNLQTEQGSVNGPAGSQPQARGSQSLCTYKSLGRVYQNEHEIVTDLIKDSEALEPQTSL